MNSVLIRIFSLNHHFSRKIQVISVYPTRKASGQIRTDRDSGGESDSEKWRRLVSDGFSSTFEDEDGEIITPRGTLSNATPLKTLKSISLTERGSYFIDWKRVKFMGGKGGDGCISFLHLLNCMNAGPDGGDGGNGGHIILKADSQVKSLAGVLSHYRGARGLHGEGKDMTGASGEHTYIDVPIGTLVKTVEDETLADLDTPGSMFIAARGGAGGKGNHFYHSQNNRHPRVAEVGAEGEEATYFLEMKCVAHCGFVGFPNVGKSTLLRSISRARPKVASYPFTTLRPHVGIIRFDDYVQLAIADLPGLIPDAHKNKGLGIDFLRHIERCVCLMYVIDLSRDKPWEQLEALKYELEMFKVGLSKRPHAIIGNKLDTSGAEERLKELRQYIETTTPDGTLTLPVIPISAKFGLNLKEFVDHLRALYDLYKHEAEENSNSFEW